MKIKSNQIFLNRAAVLICPGKTFVTIISVFCLYISSHSSTQSGHVRFISGGGGGGSVRKMSLVCDR